MTNSTAASPTSTAKSARARTPPSDTRSDDDDDGDDCTPLGDLASKMPELVASTESERRFHVPGCDMDNFSPDHFHRGLLSPAFNGGEVSYRKDQPPVPAALMRQHQAQQQQQQQSAQPPAALQPSNVPAPVLDGGDLIG